MDVLWPYKDKETYVIIRNPMNEKENIHFIAENEIESISRFREQSGKDIWLVGGGKPITTLLNESMVDEMIITTIPVILGSGISLFPHNPKESKWKLENNESYKNGVTQVTYFNIAK